jgi:MFS family permease
MTVYGKFETMELNAPEAGWQNRASEVMAPARALVLDRIPQASGVLLLLLSVALAEVASNVVYVVLVERAYQIGGGATAIGIVLIIQAAAQVIFGSWAGGLADQFGFRRAAGMAALITTPLVLALAIAQNILFVYILAFLFMLTRLLLIPARFGLVAHLTDKSRLAEANTAILILAGVGSFVGPAIAAVLLVANENFGLLLLVAGAGWLLSIPPLVMIRAKPRTPIAARRLSFFDEMQVGWRLIQKRRTISQVLTCLIIAALILGAITLLFTPLSRQLGLGPEGTGIFFSALGLGYLLGPFIATVLFKRIRLSNVLLISGLLAPIGLVLIGTLENLAGVLVAIALVSAAGASLNVIVTTITQRLTPPNHRGSVLGTEQALIGLAWIVSLGAVTGVTAVWDAESNARLLFIVLGSIGFISILSCWFWNKRPIRAACELCEPRFRLSSVACWALQGVPFGLSGAGCGVICGKECQCCS